MLGFDMSTFVYNSGKMHVYKNHSQPSARKSENRWGTPWQRRYHFNCVRELSNSKFEHAGRGCHRWLLESTDHQHHHGKDHQGNLKEQGIERYIGDEIKVPLFRTACIFVDIPKDHNGVEDHIERDEDAEDSLVELEEDNVDDQDGSS